MTHAATPSASTATPSGGAVPEILLRSAPAGTIEQPNAWKASQYDSGADIRFKKPSIGDPNTATKPAQASESTNAFSALRRLAPITLPVNGTIISDAKSERPTPKQIGPAQPATPGVVFAAPRSAEQPLSAQTSSVGQGAESRFQRITPAAAAERVATFFQQSATNNSSQANQESITQPAAMQAESPSVASNTRSDVRLTDEQLQLVSRILIDSEVVRAAEEEALPPAPGDATTVKRNGPELGGEQMYYGADCCPPQPRLFWTAGIEATFLNPDLNSNGVSLEVEEIDDDRYSVCNTLSNDVDSIYVSPRIWLGVQGCAWGANLRYWHLQASEGAFDPSIGGLGTWDDYDCGVPDFGFNTCSGLEAYTIDLELTRRFCLNDCAMQAAVGLRHANIETNESLWGLANTDEGLLTGMARANRLSRGTGLMLGLYGRKPIFPCSCVHWFYNARWSALWGPTQTSAETFASVQTIVDPNISGSAASVNGAYTNVDDTMFIGEIQLGLEWDYCLQCVPANAFFRAAIEYQRWDGGTGFSQSQSFAGATIITEIDPTSIITANAAAAEPQLDLFGISLATGLSW